MGCAQVVFLFTDAHVVDEGFLELINNILTLGMVPSLFREEEKETLRSAVRDEVGTLHHFPRSPKFSFTIFPPRVIV
jgi:hypothetical protein